MHPAPIRYYTGKILDYISSHSPARRRTQRRLIHSQQKRYIAESQTFQLSRSLETEKIISGREISRLEQELSGAKNTIEYNLSQITQLNSQLAETTAHLEQARTYALEAMTNTLEQQREYFVIANGEKVIYVSKSLELAGAAKDLQDKLLIDIKRRAAYLNEGETAGNTIEAGKKIYHLAAEIHAGYTIVGMELIGEPEQVLENKWKKVLSAMAEACKSMMHLKNKKAKAADQIPLHAPLQKPKEPETPNNIY